MPALRFRGFYDAWEQRKLGNVVNVLDGDRGKNYPSRENFSNQGHTVFLSASNVTKNGFSFEVNQYISELKSNSMGNGKLIRNDIVLTSRGSLGHVAWYNDDLASTNPFVRINSGMLILRVLKDVDARYIVQYLKSPLGSKKIELISFGSAQPQLTKKDISNYGIELPSYEEQQKIGAFFKQLDNLITQNERKVNLLKQLKQAYLQKIFSQELRFAGFSNAWKERKLKDVTERVRSNDGRMDLPTLTMSASSGWLDQKDRFSGDISGNEKKNYTLLKKGELSYNHGNSKLAKYGVVFSLKNYEEALVPRVYHSFKALANTSADFIEYMFSTKLPDRELGKLVSSGARMDGLLNINYDDFMNIHITFPNYEEQILMSAFFRKLDNTIALHQQKLNLLKKQKQAYLQKMFI